MFPLLGKGTVGPYWTFPFSSPHPEKKPPGSPGCSAPAPGLPTAVFRVPFLGAGFGVRGLKDAERAAKAARGGTVVPGI